MDDDSGPPPPPPRHAAAADAPEHDGSIYDDQDGAQAALQPAMSRAASHFTSSHTPAAEKAAALDRAPGGGLFDASAAAPSTPEPDESDPEPGPVGRPGPRGGLAGDGPSDAAAAPLREAGRTRSKSTGQEALRRLSRAFPTHLLPSLPTSFFSGFTGEHKQVQAAAGASQSDTPPSAAPVPQSPRAATPAAAAAAALPLRPSPLRRVTSDDSVLYHSLSRASSLGDDERFHDVREMVNIRFMALKDSLPEVPNFKMPSLAKLQMSSISLNGFFGSSDDAVDARQPDRGRDVPADAAAASSSSSPKPSPAAALDRVLEQLTGDIVILGGYRGSVLRSAEPPHQQLWAPVKLGFNMRKANLEVGLDDDDEATMEERIVPSGMLQHIGPVDISRKLFKRLRSCPNARSGRLRVWDYGYDWRLSPALSSRRLLDFVASLPSNQPGGGAAAERPRGAVVIAHSLGGLITRHAVNQRPHLFAGVLYAGTPQRCVNILGPLRHGDAVLFNEKLLTAQVNFSIRTSFALLPDDGFCFINKETGEEYPVDFMDADDWVRWRLSPCVADVLPPYGRDRDRDRDRQPPSPSPLSALFPNALLKGSRAERKSLQPGPAGAATVAAAAAVAPHLDADASAGSTAGSSADSSAGPPPPPPPPRPASPSAPDRDRSVAYLRRTLAATRKFRAELAHRADHEAANAYPPHAVLYGKTIPTVYAAQVPCRDAVPCADAYDDLLFRPGDGVVLAREAMLPDGYALVRAGRVSTERGHLTMLGDLPAVARALEALVRGRGKGIGLGRGRAVASSPPPPPPPPRGESG